VKQRVAGRLTLAAAWLGVAVCGSLAAEQAMAADSNAARPDAATLELGRKVYNARCYFCHGYSGDAKTLAARVLNPAPRDFTRGSELTPQAITDAVAQGRPGTAMQAFRSLLSETETTAVAEFVADEFVRHKARNTAYHVADNGWPEHQRYAAAFPFANGTLALDAPAHALSAEQQRGRALYLSACISCHDRARANDEGPAWSWRPLSYPRPDSGADASALASPSEPALQGAAPRVNRLSARERRGERLFQANCAFCHGADGTGKNWIGQFLEPKARDLTRFTAQDLPEARLRRTIRDGLHDTSMPAWRNVLTPTEIDAVSAYVARTFLRRDAP
jgi:cytochrome c oxidase cbb3-type subunit III